MKALKYIAALIVQILISSVCLPQREKIDSLQKILPSLHDSARTDCLNALSAVYLEINRDSMSYYAEAAYTEALKINYIRGLAQAASNRSNVEFHSNNITAGEQLARESLDWYQKTSDKKGLADAYLNLGYAMFGQSFFPEAIKNLDSSYELYSKESDINGMGIALYHASGVYIESGDYEKAFEKSLDLHQLVSKHYSSKLNSLELQCFSELYRNIEDFTTALLYYRKAHQLNPGDWESIRFAELFSLNKQFDSSENYYRLIDTSDQGILTYYLVGTGESYLQQNQYDRALPNLMRSLNYNKQANDINQVMRVMMDIAKCYVAANDYSLAYKYAKEALKLAQRKGSKQFLIAGYEILYTFYDKQHKADSALLYYKKFTATKDSVQSEQFKGKLTGFKYSQRIELLSKEKELQQAQLQKQSLLKNILIGSTIILLLLAAIIVRNIALKRKNETHRRELAENELQIQKLETQKQLAELEMQALRAQINPHFIFNSLNSINRFILQNNKTQASEYLTKFSRLVRLILQNSQSALIPLESELESLQLYLELEAVRFDNHFEFTINIDNNLETDIIKVPPLIIQPYAENAIWHGLMHKEEKGHLEIELFQQENILCCRIADDGIGRKKALELKSKSTSTHKSMGMQITASRIEMLQQKKQLDASIKITDLILPDGTAGGTEVVLKIPVCYD